MKIAICLSGEIESCEKICQSLLVIDKDLQVDYFIHTWDFNIDFDELSELIKYIGPKKVLIEDISIYSSRKTQLDDRTLKFKNNGSDISVVSGSYTVSDGCLLSDIAPKIYSSMRCENLKRDYEIENNFNYDICVRCELSKEIDIKNINFTPIIKNIIYSINNNTINIFPYYSIDYDFFYCDSQTYGKIGSLYNLLPQFPKHAFNNNVNEVFEFFRQTLLIKNEKINFLI